MNYQITSAAQAIQSPSQTRLRLTNAGSTVYYKTTNDVSSSSNDGSIADTASYTLKGKRYFCTAAGGAAVLSGEEVDAFGFSFTQQAAPLSQDAVEFLAGITGVSGDLTGTSLTVTGAIAGGTGTFSGLVAANAGVDVQAALAGPVYKGRQVATNAVLGNKLLTADANYSFNVLGDGKLQWGAGGATAIDTNLYRSAADTLKTDDSLIVTGTLTAGTFSPPSMTFTGTGKTTLAFSDTTTTTGLTIGADTNLYRNAADTLKTDDALVVTGALTSGAFSATTGTFSSTLGVTGLLSATAGVEVNAALAGAPYLSRQIAANKVLANNLVSTDANNAFNILGDGKLQWGAGGASAVDANLYRSGAGVLTTDTALTITGRLTSATSNIGGIVAALPGSPVDGDLCFFQSTAMATAGTVWMLRYRSGGGTSKWEYVGGPPLLTEVATSETTASTTYAALATAGPAVLLPLAGDYIVEHGCTLSNASGGSVNTHSYDIGGTGAVDADAASGTVTASVGFLYARTKLKTGLTAITLTSKYKVSTGTGTFLNRYMKVTPVRVG